MLRIYLDNAATSWPKPAGVYASMDRYLRDNGASSGRSTYSHAGDAQRIVDAARGGLARLIGATDSSHVIFALNATGALNTAIRGLLRAGDHAVCTAADHNSVLRPLADLAQFGGVEVTRVPCDRVGLVDPDQIRAALRPSTRLVAMLHASNVTGAVQPAAEVGRLVRQHGRARFLVDAAQTMGHLPVSVDELSADFLAAPGHKGLLGPLGTGFLYIRPGLEAELRSCVQGGTGTQSQFDRHPDELPEKFEAGSHNVVGLAGLAAALQWLEGRLLEIAQHEQRLASRLRAGLLAIPGVRLHAPEGANAVGVVSISIPGYDPHEAAAALDAGFGIQVRAGLHCAPELHRAMRTLEHGGTIRFSIGAFNSESDVEAALSAVGELSSAAAKS